MLTLSHFSEFIYISAYILHNFRGFGKQFRRSADSCPDTAACFFLHIYELLTSQQAQ